MDPLKVSAQFIAFTWFAGRNGSDSTDAVLFARDHWFAFLPLANEGLGRLLIALTRSDRLSGRSAIDKRSKK